MSNVNELRKWAIWMRISNASKPFETMQMSHAKVLSMIWKDYFSSKEFYHAKKFCYATSFSKQNDLSKWKCFSCKNDFPSKRALPYERDSYLKSFFYVKMVLLYESFFPSKKVLTYEKSYTMQMSHIREGSKKFLIQKSHDVIGWLVICQAIWLKG